MRIRQANYLSIDPGLYGTGYAVWNTQHWCLLVPPIRVGVFSPMRQGNFLERATLQAEQVEALCKKEGVTKVWIEFPVFYASSAGGYMVAATGDLLKLCACAGAIASRTGCLVVPVPVSRWKGQLPKKVVIKRIRSTLGDLTCERLEAKGLRDDAWDAVGIGLWAKGWFQ